MLTYCTLHGKARLSDTAIASPYGLSAIPFGHIRVALKKLVKACHDLAALQPWWRTGDLPSLPSPSYARPRISIGTAVWKQLKPCYRIVMAQRARLSGTANDNRARPIDRNEQREEIKLKLGEHLRSVEQRSLLRHPDLAQALELPVNRFEIARIAVRIGEELIQRLPRRDRLGPVGNRREVILEGFMGLRLVTGQGERRDEIEMRRHYYSD